MDALITAADIAEGRAMAESMMVDRYRVTRPGDGPRVFDNATGQYTGPEPVVVYEGRGWMQVRADINSNAVEATTGDHEFTYRTATLQLPMSPGDDAQGRPDTGDPADIVTDCVVTILESPYDPSRVGRVLNLHADTKQKTHASCRKFSVREVLS
jgi:hypothetical protein